MTKIRDEYRKFKKSTDEKSDQLVIERDNASDERYRARIRCDEIKKKIIEFEGKISETKIEYNNMRELSEEVISSLAAERDQFQDDARHLNGEYKENMMKLELLNRKYDNINDISKSQPTKPKMTTIDTRRPSNTEPDKGKDSGIDIDLFS